MKNVKVGLIRVQAIRWVAALAALCTSLEAADAVFTERPIGAPKGNYAAVAMGDIDRDGRAEILSGRRDGEEGLYLFSFRQGKWRRREINPDGEYGGVALADLTGDGILDIVAVKTSGSPKGVEILESVLKGRELRFRTLSSPYSERSCDDLAVDDIESDGDLDLAVSTGGKGVKVLLNDGKAREFRVLTLETKTYEDTGIGLGDVNGDGRLDVIVGNHPRKNPRLFLCGSSGSVNYDRAYSESLAAPGIGFEVVVVDFDGNGFNDVTIGTSGGLKVFLGNGCRGVETQWWREASVPDRGHNTMQVAVGDLNGDGKSDLTFACESGFKIILNRGGGRFSTPVPMGLPTKGVYSGCCLFDWDGDGDLDLAGSSLQGAGVPFYENRGKR